jgi:hypothetical protein
VDVTALRSDILQELYAQNQAALSAREARIEELEGELAQKQGEQLPLLDIVQELRAQHPELREFTMNRNVLFGAQGEHVDTVLVAVAQFKGRMSPVQQDRIRQWLKVRTRTDSVLLVLR